jgi:hydroxypyruvate isomerase
MSDAASSSLNRRSLLGLAGAGLLGAGALPGLLTPPPRTPIAPSRLRQSVCRWPFSDIPDREFYPAVKALGFEAVDLLTEKEWPLAEAAGLSCSMAMPTERRDFIRRGLNDRANHALLLEELARTIRAAKRQGIERVIAMVGNREGRSDAEGVEACAEALRQIVPLAEAEGITICFELLNSRVDHHDFMGDRMAFGLQLMYTVNSPRVRLLYDIYHMQIMDGDIIRTIRDQGHWISHYHTAGNPGRNELDGSQELQYPAIAAAIADSGFTGWIAHEFLPTRDWKAGLAVARRVCGGG